MWSVSNHTPFGATGYFVRDQVGTEHWVVAVVGCFDVRPDGLLSVGHEQPQPLLTPAFKDRNKREMCLDTDLAPFRPLPDIVVSGIATPPGNCASDAFLGTITVGKVHKTAQFFGERVARLTRGRILVEHASPVLGIHLTWRNALGGADLSHPGDGEPATHPGNPIGMGWLSSWRRGPDGLELALPFIEAPDIPTRIDRPLPAPHGLGPLLPAWMPRAGHSGTFDEEWQRTRAPLPPDDFSTKSYQAAPADQVHPAALDGGAPVWVDGFHPDGPYGFNLPQLIITSRSRIGAEAIDGKLRLIGMALDASAKQVRLTWNTSVPCNGRDHLVTGSRLVLKQMAGVVG